MKHKTIALAVLAAGILAAGCRHNGQEIYRDDTFEAMLQDSTYMHREQELNNDTAFLLPDFLADWEQPLRCPPKADTLIRRMADWFNSSERVNAIATDVHTFQRYYDDGPLGDSLEREMLACWRRITFGGISDTFALRRLREARDVDTEGRGDPSLKDISDVASRLDDWLPDLDSVYFVDTLLPQLSPQHYLPATVPDIMEAYIGREASPKELDVAQLYADYHAEQDYDARMAYLFTLLGTMHHLGGDTLQRLLCDAEEAMQSGRYSSMMPLVWRAYRVGYVLVYSCPSTYCYVPNIRFNHYRRLVAYTYLRHLQRHPEDNLAKIQYYYLAQQDNINRFGEYMFGNQSGAEFINLFWNGEWL